MSKTISIIQKEKCCYFCGRTTNLELHHVFEGTANRKLSDEDGLVVWLCYDHHRGNFGVHFNKDYALRLKKIAERVWLAKNKKKIKDFIDRYGKNYL